MVSQLVLNPMRGTRSLLNSLVHQHARCQPVTSAAHKINTSLASLKDTSRCMASTSGEAQSDGRLPRLLVFGGRGFVGSHIVQEALNQGLSVTSISRSGTPPAKKEAWMDQVEWVRGSALEPRSYQDLLPSTMAVISAVGGFGNQEEMLKVNGTANVTAIKAAAEAGVPRFVFISAHIPPIPGIEVLLKGYVEGKRQAEAALKEYFPKSGVALRPSVIYGNRVVSSSLTLPLQYVFEPLEKLLEKVPSKQLSTVPFLGAAAIPPADVRLVAKAAVQAATDSSVPAGVVDVWELPQFK